MKKFLVILSAIGILVAACTDLDDDLTTANIRLKNNAGISFNLVEFIPDSLFYENVPSDGFSNYLEFEEAFEAMPFTIETDSMTFNYTPEETEMEALPIGLYTYEINITDEGEVLVNFKID
ncbi:MAG: hypothetical protein HKO09_09240 [Croceitalea sp.]|nr:hypothetical protein [Croceitalea sp.]